MITCFIALNLVALSENKENFNFSGNKFSVLSVPMVGGDVRVSRHEARHETRHEARLVLCYDSK